LGENDATETILERYFSFCIRAAAEQGFSAIQALAILPVPGHWLFCRNAYEQIPGKWRCWLTCAVEAPNMNNFGIQVFLLVSQGIAGVHLRVGIFIYRP
jgi:hypothetical protein